MLKTREISRYSNLRNEVRFIVREQALNNAPFTSSCIARLVKNKTNQDLWLINNMVKDLYSSKYIKNINGTWERSSVRMKSNGSDGFPLITFILLYHPKGYNFSEFNKRFNVIQSSTKNKFAQNKPAQNKLCDLVDKISQSDPVTKLRRGVKMDGGIVCNVQNKCITMNIPKILIDDAGFVADDVIKMEYKDGILLVMKSPNNIGVRINKDGRFRIKRKYLEGIKYGIASVVLGPSPIVQVRLLSSLDI